MKKLFALLMALAMVLSMSVTAFATGTGTEPVPETGSITINGVGAETTYEVYKLLDLESYDVAAGAYSYKANAAWAEFFAKGEAKKYFSTDADGYVTWTWEDKHDPLVDTCTKEEAIADFAKLALDHAKENGIKPVKSSKNNTATEKEFVVTESAGKFSGLDLGYYLVDSTMGALCGLTTTNPDASINAKNGIPTIDKQVLENSTKQWGAANTADIGQIVEYRVTINVHAGAQNYVLHDAMEDGLTFQNVTEIQHVIPGKETHIVPTEKYTVKTDDVCDEIIKVGDTNVKCDFEVHFTKDFCDTLETNDKIIVHYKALLNRNAVVAGSGNVNTAQLTFGEGGKSTPDSVTTYTYGIDIVKTDSGNKLIDGAKFRIYDAAGEAKTDSEGNVVITGGKEVGVVPLMQSDDKTPVLDANGNQMYRRAREDENDKTVDIVVTNGRIRVVGLDNGTYYLEETEAPDGYNKLSARQKFIISDGNLDATFNGDIYSTGSGVHVVNKTGSMLPETGAMGTMLFITFGMTVVLGTGVLLVTKKRMSMIQD